MRGYVALNLKKEIVLKPIANENMSKGGKGEPILAYLNVRETIAKLSKVAEGTIQIVFSDSYSTN